MQKKKKNTGETPVVHMGKMPMLRFGPEFNRCLPATCYTRAFADGWVPCGRAFEAGFSARGRPGWP
jgi:hypothetical protein